jgi:hypothetical protein
MEDLKPQEVPYFLMLSAMTKGLASCLFVCILGFSTEPLPGTCPAAAAGVEPLKCVANRACTRNQHTVHRPMTQHAM